MLKEISLSIFDLKIHYLLGNENIPVSRQKNEELEKCFPHLL